MQKEGLSAGCNTSYFGNFEITLFSLTDSIKNCYHLPESGHNAEKDDGDSWDKVYCVEQHTENVNSNQLYIKSE